MAGGGIKAGYEHEETDDFSYNIVRDPVHSRDLNATILHQLASTMSVLPTSIKGWISASPEATVRACVKPLTQKHRACLVHFCPCGRIELSLITR